MSLALKEARESYDKAGIGAVRAGFGKRPGLIIVDMQNDLVGAWANQCISSNRKLLSRAREARVPVFFTRATVHPSKEGIGLSTWKPLRDGKVVLAGTRGHQIIEELRPDPHEFVIDKRRPSAFFGTDLDIFIRSLNLDTLVITGVTTSGCVRCTVTDAFMRDYKVIVPKECVSEQSKVVHQNNLFDINAKFGEVVSLQTAIDYVEHVAVQRA